MPKKIYLMAACQMKKTLRDQLKRRLVGTGRSITSFIEDAVVEFLRGKKK